ncbi:hypothetical protein DJ010_20685 [Nocardioides silvaticus]|uniref:DUF222 domain-containing protein n=1 Tax=Nocardioides silvaticus TaxID=2201891 RepID=A0A316T9P7_9ACTN|nr:hypothetical protein [Nocardioides silvaticus]PWN01033.1 hypothetical protein DJ010_20685 [Nocardioides silvaticus]
MISGIVDFDASAVVAASEALERELREHEVDVVRLVLQWAAVHSEDPGKGVGGGVAGGDRLMALGGEGTPWVQELCWAELAIARSTSLTATRRLAADSLDLAYRLPLVWQAVQDLRLPVWVARKVAAMSRSLSKDAVALVDVAVAAAADQSPARVIAIAEGKVIEADLEAHRARVAADAANLGVRVSRPRPGAAVDPVEGEPATLRTTLKLPPGTTLGFVETVEEVADALAARLTAAQLEQVTRGELQAQAVELLSNPAAAAAFLDPTQAEETQCAEPTQRKRGPAVVYVHLSDLVLGGAVAGVARLEGIGPMLVEQLAELLGHREIALQPVIDLNETHAVNGYEHPAGVKHRTLLRMLGDVFPHSGNLGYRRLDHDHPRPWVPPDESGPPGQTGDHNDAPLTRTYHRAKTHVGYHVDQIALGAYRWVTPHGLARMVTRHGTARINLIRGPDGDIIGETYDGPRIELHLRE